MVAFASMREFARHTFKFKTTNKIEFVTCDERCGKPEDSAEWNGAEKPQKVDLNNNWYIVEG